MLPKGILYLGKYRKRKVGWQSGTVLGGGNPKGTMGLPYMASNGLIFKGVFLVRPGPLSGLKGGV